MFYFPFDFVLSVQRVGCKRLEFSMNSEWSSQHNGQSTLIMDYFDAQQAEEVYIHTKEQIAG